MRALYIEHESIRVLYFPDRKAAILRCSSKESGESWYLGNKTELKRAREIADLMENDPSVITLEIDAHTTERLVALAEDQSDHRKKYSSTSEDLQVAERNPNSEAIRRELKTDIDKELRALRENDLRINEYLRSFGIEFVTRP